MSNYPPGVTGNEFAIAGPDFEEERYEWCTTCEATTEQVLYGYRHERWIVCTSCRAQRTLDDNGE